MVHQSPTGARDLLPLDVAQKRWIEERLQRVFESWGYHCIITSTLERLDTLMVGEAVQRSTVIQFQDAEDEILGLRPELTASIARTAATRMAGSTYPQRLYYHANVFRRPHQGNHTGQHEFFQSGVELLGGGGVVADAEILLLLAECLKHLGLDGCPAAADQGHVTARPSWSLILGEAGLTRSLLEVFPNTKPDFIRDRVQQAIAHLDRVTLETLELSPTLRERALLLFDLRGQPRTVLQRVSKLDLTQEQHAIVTQLKALVELLEESFSPQSDQTLPTFPLVLDLSLIQTFDYYTGIVFKVVSLCETGQRILGQGGRYDELLGRYHPKRQTRPGIGFTLNIEDLQQVLLHHQQLPTRLPTSDLLVVPRTPEAQSAAFTQAQKLREQATSSRVEIYLEEQPELVRDYARRLGILHIVWCSPEGLVESEAVL